MNKKTVVSFLVIIIICSLSYFVLAQQKQFTFLNTEKIKLIDAFSGKDIINTDVNIHSNNRVVCIMGPCPNENQEWKGRSDANGFIFMPSKMNNEAVYITATDHKTSQELGTHGQKIAEHNWILELDPDSKIGSFGRRLKLIDAQTGQTLNNTKIWITKSQSCIPPTCTDFIFLDTTNNLGNFYYDIRSLGLKDDKWVVVPNHDPVKMDGADRLIIK